MTHLIISKINIVVGIFIVHHRSNKVVIIIVSNGSQSDCKVFVFFVAWPFRLTSSWCSVPRDLESCFGRNNYEMKFTLSIDIRKQTSSYGTHPSGQNPDQFTGVSKEISIMCKLHSATRDLPRGSERGSWGLEKSFRVCNLYYTVRTLK